MVKLKRKLIQRFFIVATSSVLLTALAFSIVNWLNYSNQVENMLISYGQVLVESYNINPDSKLLSTYNPKDYRINLIDTNGNVIYESNKKVDINNLDNHLKRPEIQEAIKSGIGKSSRYSTTIRKIIHYYAIKTDDNKIIRISCEEDSIAHTFSSFVPVISLIVLCVLILSIYNASRSTQRIVKPIERMTININDVAYEELVPFANTIEKQQKQIKKQIEQVQIEKDKIEALIANMNEGFLLLDMEKTILTENDSAAKLLGSIDIKLIGRNVIEFSSNSDFIECIHNAITGKSGSVKFSFNEKKIQVIASPVMSGEKQNGVICLIMDITEKEKTEKIRREFTANVSHELKTPLTSISGFAEMIENGMVQPNDIQRFAGKIHKEAGRMINLISDIIELSHLDEPEKGIEKQLINLKEVTEDCFESLASSAEKRNVTLNYHGKEIIFSGNQPMLYEVIYNLCDNAIRYSKNDGGKVDVIIKDFPDKIELSVKDTGIGIPLSHQNRVFERFYRVDKSHSKETGGTGLGLAIVKHIVEQHKGYLDIESKVNVGTTIKITLPK